MNCTHLIFDLDDTLYNSKSMGDAISSRMIDFAADFFHISYDEASELRKAKKRLFATTLDWLINSGMEDVEKYFAHVHPPTEIDELTTDANLRPLLQSLPHAKSILTNSPREHAKRVLEKLNVADLFSDITDVRDTGYKGKPYAEAYYAALKKADCQLENALFLDDCLKYCEGWEILGGTAVLVGTKQEEHLSESKDALAAIEKYIGQSGIPLSERHGKIVQIESIYELPTLLKNTSTL